MSIFQTLQCRNSFGCIRFLTGYTTIFSKGKDLSIRHLASCNAKHQLQLKVETIVKQKKEYEEWMFENSIIDGNNVKNQNILRDVIEYLEYNIPPTTLYTIDYNDYLKQRFNINMENSQCSMSNNSNSVEKPLNLSPSSLELFVSTPQYVNGNPAGNGVCGWFLSKFLTYPLTMSYGLKQISAILKKSKSSNGSNSNNHNNNIVVNTLVVGARAECWMKPTAWDECIYTLGGALCSGSTDINITLTGPGLIQHIPPVERAGRLWPGGRICLQPYDSKLHCFLHEYKDGNTDRHSNLNTDSRNGNADSASNSNDAEGLVSNYDVIFLFNPGVGYNATITESMRTQAINTWIPTMKVLLKSFKPIIITSLNVSDYTRDLKLWYAVCDELNQQSRKLHMNNKYHLELIIKPPHSDSSGYIHTNLSSGVNHSNNPYQSYAYEIDEYDPLDPIVMPNHIIYGIQLVTVQE